MHAYMAWPLPVVFKPLHEVPPALHIVSIYLHLYATLTSGLAVSTNELMSWIRCDYRWGRHTKCAGLGYSRTGLRATDLYDIQHHSQTQFLEVHSSAQFRSNPNQTPLIQIIKVFRITRNFHTGVNQGCPNSVLQCLSPTPIKHTWSR